LLEISTACVVQSFGNARLGYRHSHKYTYFERVQGSMEK